MSRLLTTAHGATTASNLQLLMINSTTIDNLSDTVILYRFKVANGYLTMRSKEFLKNTGREVFCESYRHLFWFDNPKVDCYNVPQKGTTFKGMQGSNGTKKTQDYWEKTQEELVSGDIYFQSLISCEWSWDYDWSD
ncbi:hypothetical protein Tco_0325066 [Tanacetum coccineum]